MTNYKARLQRREKTVTLVLTVLLVIGLIFINVIASCTDGVAPLTQKGSIEVLSISPPLDSIEPRDTLEIDLRVTPDMGRDNRLYLWYYVGEGSHRLVWYQIFAMNNEEPTRLSLRFSNSAELITNRFVFQILIVENNKAVERAAEEVIEWTTVQP